MSAKPRTILFVNASSQTLGGAEVCLLDLIRAASANGWRAIVALPDDGPLRPLVEEAGGQTRVLELGVLRGRAELRSIRIAIRFVQVFPAALRLALLARRERVDIIYTNSSIVVAGALAARLAGLPHIWHIREILDGRLWATIRPVVPIMSDRVVCISSAVADQFRTRGQAPYEKVIMLHDGVDLDVFRPRAGRTGSQNKTVAMVARVNRWKGHETFIRAALLVATRVGKVDFLIAGGHIPENAGLLHRLKSLAAELGLEDNVNFLGALPRSEMSSFLAALDVLVLPSDAPEPGGLALLEAMAVGVPVIATCQGGPLDFIEDGINGLLVPPTNPGAMADAIMRILEDPAKAHEMAVQARATVIQKCDLTKQSAAIVDLYSRLS